MICQIYYDYAAEMFGISECLLRSRLMERSCSRAARHLEILQKCYRNPHGPGWGRRQKEKSGQSGKIRHIQEAVSAIKSTPWKLGSHHNLGPWLSTTNFCYRNKTMHSQPPDTSEKETLKYLTMPEL